jgi:hypothetical protein
LIDKTTPVKYKITTLIDKTTPVKYKIITLIDKTTPEYNVLMHQNYITGFSTQFPS